METCIHAFLRAPAYDCSLLLLLAAHMHRVLSKRGLLHRVSGWHAITFPADDSLTGRDAFVGFQGSDGFDDTSGLPLSREGFLFMR